MGRGDWATSSEDVFPVTLSDPEIVADREALEGSRGQPRGFAFVWRRFEIPDLLAPMLACVMATVPANALIRHTIKAQEEYPRMPEILVDVAGRRQRDAGSGQS